MPEDILTDVMDPAAPKGRKPDGTPYQRRPRGTAPKAPKRTAAKAKKPDYTESVNGLFQLAALPLTFTAPADAWAVTAYAPGISAAVNDLANERPEVAALLDKILRAGPYGALIAATTPLIAQLLVNHKVLPAGFLGTSPKEQIEAHLKAEGERLQQAMEDDGNPDLIKQV